ncbi:hypothetical protein C0991_012318 [Blastosporella zonata]|nr:hypothetical protein C0991_012318 [Blastosporella zonata]
MPPKSKAKAKQVEKKTTEKKNEKKEPTPPPPAEVPPPAPPAPPHPAEPLPEPPAEPEPEPQPIPVPEPTPLPVPEPTPLPVPAPTGNRKYTDDVKGLGQEYADYPSDHELPAEDDGVYQQDDHGGGGWGGSGVEADAGGSGWENNDEELSDEGEGNEGSDYDNRDDRNDYDDANGGSGWGPPHSQERLSLHIPPPVPANPTPVPPPSQPAVPPPQAHEQSYGSQPPLKAAPPQAQGQNPPPAGPKTYILASAMANRNRPAPPPANPAPEPPPPPTNPAPQPRPSYYWDPKQPPPPKKPISTTKGQHNPALTGLSAWGEPKHVDPWGDPKPQPKPVPAPPKPAATTQGPKAWHEWGRQPQHARPPPPAPHPPAPHPPAPHPPAPHPPAPHPPAPHPPAPHPPAPHPPAPYPPASKQQPVRMNYSQDYDNEDDDEYTDDDDETYMWNDAYGRPSGSQQGRGPDLRKPHKVNYAPQGSNSGVGAGSKPALSSAEHAQFLNAMLNGVPQSHSGHHGGHHGGHPHKPSSQPNPPYQLDRAHRLQQFADEQRWLQEEQLRQQQHHHHRGGGKSSKKKHQHSDSGWGTPKDEWGARSTAEWDNGGGGSGGQGEGGHEWGHGQGGDGWNQGRWSNGGGGNSWGNAGGNNSRENEGGGEWDDSGKGGGGYGWGTNGADSSWGDGGVQEHKRPGDHEHWDNNDNSWSNAKGPANDWGESGGYGQTHRLEDGGDEEYWEEEGDHDLGTILVADPKQHKSSKTLMHAMGGSDLKHSKPSITAATTASKLGLPPGLLNESQNKAFEPAMKAIFGKERMARDRIYWSYSPENEPQVDSVMSWIQQMESHLALFGLLKFLETKERGALFVNVTFRLEGFPNLPAFDWLDYDQIQTSTDRILQHSILAADPANQTLIFVYLLSRTGNSVAMWRRKLQVPKDVQHQHLEAITKVKAGLRPEKDYRIHVDELPPVDKGKQTKATKLSKLPTKQASKAAATKPAKATKSALKTHEHGQSVLVHPEKKRKWWQILRFAD